MSAIVGVFLNHSSTAWDELIPEGFRSHDFRARTGVKSWRGSHGRMWSTFPEATSSGHASLPPHQASDGTWTGVADAFLYNQRELAHELDIDQQGGNQLSDGELVLKAWEKWGCAGLSRIEGKYALAVWDQRSSGLVLARDPLGYHPLYYAHGPWGIAFASNVKALLSLPWVSPEPNERVLAAHLLRIPPELNATAFANVLALPGPCLLRWSLGDSAPRSEVRWRARLPDLVEYRSHGEAVEAFSAEFHRAVDRCLPNGKEIGVRLSGGLDSAAVTAVAAECLVKKGRSLTVLHDLGDTGDSRKAAGRTVDESKFVKAMEPCFENAKFVYRRPWSQVLPLEEWGALVAQKGALFRGMPGEPDSQGREVEDLEFILNGLGGNYIVSWEAVPNGYFSWLVSRGKFWDASRAIRDHSRAYGHPGPLGLGRIALGRVLASFRGNDSNEIGGGSNLVPLLSERAQEDLQVMAWLRGEAEKHPARRSLDIRQNFLDILTTRMPQHRGPFAGGANPSGRAVVAESPMFNLRLNEFCLGIPPHLNVFQGWDRYLLRAAMGNKLPQEVVWRTTRGFPRPGSQTRFLDFKAKSSVAFKELCAKLPKDGLLNRDTMERYWRLTPPDGDRWDLFDPLIRAVGVAVFLNTFPH